MLGRYNRDIENEWKWEEDDSERLFASFKISKCLSFPQHLNQYDVLKINIQEFLSETHSMDEMLTRLSRYLIYDLQECYSQIRFRDETSLVQVMKVSMRSARWTYYRRIASKVEVPGTPFRISSTLEFSSCASIVADRTRYKIPLSAVILYAVPGTSDLISYSFKLLF